MMEEEKAAASSVAATEDELEFRPWVKWCGIGLAGVASLGLFLVTYYIGYGQGEGAGYIQATSSGMVQQHLNEAASQNVLNFMRLASASDEHLTKAAADTKAAFSWIQEKEVRQEAEWCLALALFERGMTDAAAKVIEPLLAAAPHTAEWAYRALNAADFLAADQQYDAACRYYGQAVSVFSENKLTNARIQALGQLISLEVASQQDSAALAELLNKHLKELESMGQEASALRSVVLVQLGMLHRAAGRGSDAETAVRAAVDGVDMQQKMTPEQVASYGLALLELGDVAAAEPLLRIAEKNAGNRPVDLMSRLLAMRQLASLECERGNTASALALLHRAHGAAEGRMPSNNVFWACLYDQRGWAHFSLQNFELALSDFTAALAVTKDALLQMQPMEGAARCHMELGRNQEALPMLEQCLQLRQKHAAADKPAMGRLYLLLAQMYDSLGKVNEAETSYAAAVANLTGNTPDELVNRRTALMGHAYILSDLKRWADSYAAWEQVLPLLNEQYDRREEARAQMRRIKPFIPAEPQPETEQPAS